MAEIEAIFDACLLKLETGATIEESLQGYAAEQAEIAPLLQVAAALRSLAVPVPARTEQTRQATRSAFLAAAVAVRDTVPVPGEDALEESLTMLAAGATTDDCAAAFPKQAMELRSSLDIVQALQLAAEPAPQRDAAQIARERQAFLAVAREQAREQRKARGLAATLAAWSALFRQPAWRAVAVVFLLLVTFFGLGGTALTLASDALPGDPLYPVKLVAERAQVAITLDEGRRAQLQVAIDQRRREEAAAVVGAGRQIEVKFPGIIESMVDGVWMISGMDVPIFVPGDAEVVGMPAAGRQVLVTGYSDGQGRLIVRQVIVFGGDGDGASPTPTATLTATPARAVAPPVRPPDTATARPQPTDTSVLRPTVTAVLSSTPTLTATETLTPSLTATPTATSSGTPTVSPTPSATLAPYPGTRSGLIDEKHPNWWLVNGFRILLTPETLIDESLGPADVGALVVIEGIELPDPPAFQAVLITVMRSTVETRQWTDRIQSISGSIWVVGNTAVDVSGASISGTPGVGKVASVSARRSADEMWHATNVSIEDEVEPVPIFGTITSISGNIWGVGGYSVNVAGATITGLPPAVGLYASIEAVEENGQLRAITVDVSAPFATDTPTVTPTGTPGAPTATPTGTVGQPTATPTGTIGVPTETPTGAPTVTPTGTPGAPTETPTGTPAEPPPTPTNTPAEPTATPTPPPTSTPTDEPPIPTNTPSNPTATATAIPTSPPISTPTPTAVQPPPTATYTPVPTLPFTPPPPPTFEAPWAG